MCLECHSKLSDNNIREQLLNEIEKKRFDKWNTTSVSHMFIIASGFNGNINKKLAIQLLKDFLEYINNKPIEYLPETGVEKMYHKDKLYNALNHIISNKISNINELFSLFTID
jgi:hypothetical protein